MEEDKTGEVGFNVSSLSEKLHSIQIFDKKMKWQNQEDTKKTAFIYLNIFPFRVENCIGSIQQVET